MFFKKNSISCYFNFFYHPIIKQKGVALYISLMMMTLLLTLVLGMGAIVSAQIRAIRGLGDSVLAFYAADTGIEQVLLNRHNPVDIPKTSLPNEASYEVKVIKGGTEGCPAPHFCIRSIGTFKETRRAIEVIY